MNIPVLRHHPLRLLAVLASSLSLVLVLGAAAFPSLAHDGATRAQAAAGARAAASGGAWGKAEEVPGIAALNKGGAPINSVSCASAGNCSAGGSYYDGSAIQAFVVDEAKGIWRKAHGVPGVAALNKDGDAQINSVSCAKAGNCSAGGNYTDGFDNVQVFVVDEAKGIWGKAHEVSGIAALNKGGFAEITSVSCGSAGNCSAVGDYRARSHGAQLFVADETKGIWGKAHEVPGVAALNKGGDAFILSVSCARAGDCSAGGYYTGTFGHQHAFVVDEVKGAWRKARQVPGAAALSRHFPGAAVDSVSCASAGNCSAGGFYTDRFGFGQAFVISEVKGTWGKAEEVPGFAALNKGSEAGVTSVSCASAGNCSAGGGYEDGSADQQVFVVAQAKHTWGKAEKVLGLTALNKGGIASLDSLSCASAGNCSAGGYYTDGSGHPQAFVVSEVKGTWGKAEEVPGFAALNKGGGSAGVTSVSCPKAGHCSAGGVYSDTSSTSQAFVVNRT
jgi:hypothetical protein